jgi:hypothetical protein
MIQHIALPLNAPQLLLPQIQQPILKPIPYDTFEKTQNTLETTINNAKKKIMEVLHSKNVEYGFVISPDKEILEETEGDEHKCSFDSRKVVKDSILLHGHPVEFPLSSGDVSALLVTGAKTQEAITKNGKYSKLTKKHSFQSKNSYSQLYQDLEKQLCQKAMDKLGISYTLNSDDIIDMFKDFYEYNFGIPKEKITDDDALAKMEELKISVDDDEIENSFNKLKDLLFFPLLSNPTKYDKVHNSIIDNYPEIQNYLQTKEGIETRHEFLSDIANTYDLIYETNLF